MRLTENEKIAKVQLVMGLAMKEAGKIAAMPKDDVVALLEEQARALPARKGKARLATAARISACAFRLALPQLDW